MLTVPRPKRQRQQCAEDRGRQRDENDQRIAEALVLRGEHQVDNDQREDEGDDEAVAFLHVLAAFSLEIVGEGLGNTSLDFAVRKSMASPTVRPGNGDICN